ncbi:hypothetical protein ACFORO_12350 [Amycolatopsis halotolerans]|uniref:Uncharacterized protein n=1 Tax=Amycolatopsis halotolerans TaxID=330083 RepID=A0ABV7QF41_9PSEU
MPEFPNNTRIEWNPSHGNYWMPGVVTAQGSTPDIIAIRLDDETHPRDIYVSTRRLRLSQVHQGKTPAEYGINPSNPETRQTPSPVSYVEGGENASERASQPVETASPGEVVRSLVDGFNAGSAEMGKELRKILRGSGLIGPEFPASERPNAGQETAQLTLGAVPSVIHALRVELERETARADAAEAKLAASKTVREAYVAEMRRLAAERDLALWLHAEAKWRHANEHAANTTLGFGLLQLERERDEALSTLDQIRDLAGGFHAFMLGPGRCNPDQVRTRAVAALDGIRKAFEGATDRQPTTVDQVRSSFETYLSRLHAELDEWAERDERFRPLIESVRAITVPVTDREEPAQENDLGCDACGQTKNRHGSGHSFRPRGGCDAEDCPDGACSCEEPASVWDVEADTHRISEDHEEPAKEAEPQATGSSSERARFWQLVAKHGFCQCPADGSVCLDACCRLCSRLDPECPCVMDPEADYLDGYDGAVVREEPAGETKPRVFLPGDTIPARVAVLDNFGDTQRRPTAWSIGYGTAVEILLPTTADWDDAVWAERESRGQAVERQADSEAQR